MPIIIAEDKKPSIAQLQHWCPERGSNSHAFQRHPLKMVRLPIPPSGQRSGQIGAQRAWVCRRGKPKPSTILRRSRLLSCRRPPAVFPCAPALRRRAAATSGLRGLLMGMGSFMWISGVPAPGIEPGCLSALSFESSASTDSAKRARSALASALDEVALRSGDWSGWQDLNLRSRRPERRAVDQAGPHPEKHDADRRLPPADNWSGQGDLNSRHLAPKASALPGCAIPRIWSGKRVSNSRPQPWQDCALPTELFPR